MPLFLKLLALLPLRGLLGNFSAVIFGALSLLSTLGLHAQQSPQLGDIDGDRVPTVRDLALIVEHMKGTATLFQ